jgi:glutamate carboxypeptidase
MITDLETLVTTESPTADIAATARCAHVVAQLGRRLLGREPEWHVVDGRPHLSWSFGDRPSVLLLGHLDTVWPLGSLARLPYAVTDGRLTGPGCFDMKAGLVLMLHAVAELSDRNGVVLLVTSDEETGSATSQNLIEATARAVGAALVLEASADGALKTARKGVSTFEVSVRGRAAHAGLEPELGANAAVELAHQVLAVAALTDAAARTTVTPTVLSAGATTNTVPAAASMAVDVRAFTAAEQQRVAAALGTLRPTIAGTQVRVRPVTTRPPLPASASAALFERAVLAASRLGLPAPQAIEVGGGSDGNITAGLGTPTLDGLGAVGAGAHADDEHVLVEHLPDRAALLSAVVADLLAYPLPRHARQ